MTWEQLKQAFGVLDEKGWGDGTLDQSGTIDGAEFLKFLFQVEGGRSAPFGNRG